MGMIDKSHHAGRASYALSEYQELTSSLAKARSMTSSDETLIIATSDHGHVFTFGGKSFEEIPFSGAPTRWRRTDSRTRQCRTRTDQATSQQGRCLIILSRSSSTTSQRRPCPCRQRATAERTWPYFPRDHTPTCFTASTNKATSPKSCFTRHVSDLSTCTGRTVPPSWLSWVKTLPWKRSMRRLGRSKRKTQNFSSPVILRYR